MEPFNKPIITNVADKDQITNAKKKEKLIRENELEDIKATLALPQAQRFIWRILERCKTFESIYEQSARIHYNAGQQDLGHFLMSEIINADEQLLFTMMKNNLKGEK